MVNLKGFMLPRPSFTFLLYSLHTPLTLNKVPKSIVQITNSAKQKKKKTSD